MKPREHAYLAITDMARAEQQLARDPRNLEALSSLDRAGRFLVWMEETAFAAIAAKKGARA